MFGKDENGACRREIEMSGPAAAIVTASASGHHPFYRRCQAAVLPPLLYRHTNHRPATIKGVSISIN